MNTLIHVLSRVPEGLVMGALPFLIGVECYWEPERLDRQYRSQWRRLGQLSKLNPNTDPDYDNIPGIRFGGLCIMTFGALIFVAYIFGR